MSRIWHTRFPNCVRLFALISSRSFAVRGAVAKQNGRTWEQLKTALLLQAIATGDTSATNYQKVSWEIVDQFRGATLFIPSITRTHSVKIKAEAPETPNDGTQFYMTLTLKQNGVPRETQGI